MRAMGWKLPAAEEINPLFEKESWLVQPGMGNALSPLLGVIRKRREKGKQKKEYF